MSFNFYFSNSLPFRTIFSLWFKFLFNMICWNILSSICYRGNHLSKWNL